MLLLSLDDVVSLYGSCCGSVLREVHSVQITCPLLRMALGTCMWELQMYWYKERLGNLRAITTRRARLRAHCMLGQDDMDLESAEALLREDTVRVTQQAANKKPATNGQRAEQKGTDSGKWDDASKRALCEFCHSSRKLLKCGKSLREIKVDTSKWKEASQRAHGLLRTGLLLSESKVYRMGIRVMVASA